MRKEFLGYYPPTPDEYQRLWTQGLIVLDTNVLLDLYRLPLAARNELFALLELLRDRLWIPHQVALEYQLRRLTVISSERSISEKVINDAKKVYDELTASVTSLELDKREIGIDHKPIIESFESAKNDLIDILRKAHEAQLDISSADPIRDRIDGNYILDVTRGDSQIARDRPML